MGVRVVVQARMGSRRLPGKVLLPLTRRTVLEHIFERLAKAGNIDGIVLATSGTERDRPIRALANMLDWTVVTGDEEDVLDRFLRVIDRFAPTHVVRVTADCPLVDVPGLEQVVEAHLSCGADYSHNASDTGFERLPRGSALGLGVEVIRAAALVETAKYALKAQHREHVTTFFLENPETFDVQHLPARSPKLANPDLRLTLDTAEDYEVLRRIYEALYRSGRPIDALEAVRWLEDHPEVAAINSSVLHTRLHTAYRLTAGGRLVERSRAPAAA